MKYLFTVIIIILLPLSVYGVGWTIEYEMIHPDGKVKFVKVSLPTFLKNDIWKIPYLAGRWECTIGKYEGGVGNNYYEKVNMQCSLKEKPDVTVLTEIECDFKDTKKNRLLVGLKGAKSTEMWAITIECEL